MDHNITIFIKRTQNSALILLWNFIFVLLLFAFSAWFVGKANATSVMMFQPSFQVTEEFTDNLNLEKDDRESELITLLSPQITLLRSEKTSEFHFDYAPSLSLYAKNDENNTFRHSLNAQYTREMAKHLSMSLSNHFSRTEELYTTSDDALFVTGEEIEPEQLGYTTRNEREPRSANTLGLGFDYQFGSKDALGLDYSYGRVWEESETAEDSTRHTVRTSLGYWITPQWGTNVQGGYTRGEFSGETDTFDQWTGSLRLSRAFTRHVTGFADYVHTAMRYHGDDPDYDLYDPGLGVDWIFTPNGSASVRVGYYIRDEQDEERETGLSLNLDLSKNWELNRRTAFRLSGGSGYDTTYFGSENLGFTLYTQASGVLSYALTRRTDSSLSFSYRRNKYTDQDPERRDNVYSLTGQITQQLTAWLFFNVSGSFRLVDSNIDQEEYHENRWLLSVTMTPQGWKW